MPADVPASDSNQVDQIRGHLKRLGLTEYDSRAFLALVERGAQSASELVDSAGVPQKRIYQVLHRLTALGLADKEDQRGGVFRARGSQSIRALIDERKSAILAAAGELEGIASTVVPIVDRLLSVHGHETPVDAVQVGTGIESFRVMFNEMMRSASREIVSLSRRPFLLPPDPRLNGLDLIGPKVELRTIYERRGVADMDARERAVIKQALTGWSDRGEEVRFHHQVPAKLIIADRQVAMFMIAPDTAAFATPTTIVIRDAGVAMLCLAAAESLWEQATALRAGERRALLLELDDGKDPAEPNTVTVKPRVRKSQL